MATNPIRRSQLIAPFGVGAMLVVQGGISLITAGLDHWYEKENDKYSVAEDEYIIEEWRLQRLLGVNHFRLPPDYRESWRYDNKTPNMGITVPFLRFPRWHVCPYCDRLDERPLAERGRPKCPECGKYIYQVPFIAMCEAGHLQDFPWREWVHRSKNPDCDGTLRLKSTGSATLSGQKVSCDKCGKERNLSQITTAYPDGSTYLSKHLTDDERVFYCQGRMPWLGYNTGTNECTAHLKGSLRSAANVYFAHTRSSIYLPRSTHTVPDQLIQLVSSPPMSTIIKTILDALGGIDIDGNLEKTVESIISQPRYAKSINIYRKDQILEAIRIALRVCIQGEMKSDDSLTTAEDFRREEYMVLREAAEEDLLLIRPAKLKEYDPDISKYFTRIMLVEKLKETRALTGFTRVYATNEQTLAERKSMLRKRETQRNNWLPAYVVYGEGIFFEFDEKKITEWENTPEIISRIRVLDKRYRTLYQNRRWEEFEITPRFVMLHTFSHILMNRLTFECGYSSAALKERLYVSEDADKPMSGVLVYTADGDAEGTMGGLVRMGKRGNIEPIIKHALLDATWCSADPVCMEIGGSGGQGPDSCNLAACHNCALVPETACEYFNRFLDRVTLIGDISHPHLGYFKIR